MPRVVGQHSAHSVIPVAAWLGSSAVPMSRGVPSRFSITGKIRYDVFKLSVVNFCLARDRHGEQTMSNHRSYEARRKVGSLLKHCWNPAFVFYGERGCPG